MAKKTATKKKAAPKKAAPVKKAAVKKAAVPEASIAASLTSPSLADIGLVSARDVAAVEPANIDVTFTSGVGQVTATLFRQGVMINMESISSSGTITFSDVRTGDAISINGVCAGTARIGLDRDTTPANPKTFQGVILVVFLIN